METTCLIADTEADEDVDSIPMVAFHVPDTQQLFGNVYSRLPSSNRTTTELLSSPTDVLFPVDEGAWSSSFTPPHHEYSIQSPQNIVINNGFEEEESLYFPIDESAWGHNSSPDALSQDSQALVMDETDGRVTYHNSSRPTQSKSLRSHWWQRPKSLKLHSTSYSPSAARSPIPQSPLDCDRSTSPSSSSNINQGFQDFDGRGAFNHRVDRFEQDTAMLFIRSLSQPKQSKKSFWSLFCMWCGNCLEPCGSVCCVCRSSCRDEVGLLALWLFL